MLELHGNATRARCLDCAAPYARDEVHGWLEAGVDVPACPACGGVIKPFTVLFGEAMPAWRDARGGASRPRRPTCSVVLGSSLVVYPAAYLPAHAKHAARRSSSSTSSRRRSMRAPTCVIRDQTGASP